MQIASFTLYQLSLSFDSVDPRAPVALRNLLAQTVRGSDGAIGHRTYCS